MSAYPYTMDPPPCPALGLVVLQSDVTVEGELRTMLPRTAQLLVSRVPSGTEVTTETLAAMEGHLTASASLFPDGHRFDALGYACTSGSAVIGPDRIDALLRAGAKAQATTNPVTALLAACGHAQVTRLAVLSPYVADVSATLRGVLARNGVETPVFGSFDEASEDRVARIDGASLRAAALDLVRDADCDALFLSCTNLRTLDVLPDITADTGLRVWSSNLVLGWHLAHLGGALPASAGPEALLHDQRFA